MAVPNPQTWSSVMVTVATMNTEVRDVLNFLLDPPRARLYLTGSQSILNNTPTLIAWTGEYTDSRNGHSTVTNNTDLTIAENGDYRVTVTAPWADNATGRRALTIRVLHANATTTDYSGDSKSPGAAAAFTNVASRTIPMVAGDKLQIRAFQTSGGTLNLSTATDDGVGLEVLWVSKT